MAASVVSVPLPPNDRSLVDATLPLEAELDESVEGVLPSEVDCRGRPLANVAFTVTIRRKLTLGTLRAFVASLRQPPF